MLPEEGEIEFVAAHVMVTLALPEFELSAALAAATVTVAGDGGTGGAVYSAVAAPVVMIVPSVEFPPAIPFTLQVTPAEESPVPETLAVNTCAPPVGTAAALGETVTITAEGFVEDVPAVPQLDITRTTRGRIADHR